MQNFFKNNKILIIISIFLFFFLKKKNPVVKNEDSQNQKDNVQAQKNPAPKNIIPNNIVQNNTTINKELFERKNDKEYKIEPIIPKTSIKNPIGIIEKFEIPYTTPTILKNDFLNKVEPKKIKTISKIDFPIKSKLPKNNDLKFFNQNSGFLN